MSVRDRPGHAPEDMVVTHLQALAPHLDGEPDPAFRAATRARLVAMAAVRSPAPAPVSPWKRLVARAEDAAPSRWRTRLTAGLAGAAMAVTALATLVAVSTDAGPGDALYGLKRGTEQTQLALAGDARGQTLLEFARTRLHELEDLTASGASALPAAGGPSSEGPSSEGMVILAAGADPTLILETLATMDDQTTEGAAWLADQAVETADDAPLDLLAAWTVDQEAGLAALRAAVPDSTVDELDASLALLEDIDIRTVALTDVLGCASGPPIESSDALGPVPGMCLDDPATPPAAGGSDGPVTPAPGSEAEGTTAATPTTPAVPGGGTDGGSGPTAGTGAGGLPTAEVPSGQTPTLPAPDAAPAVTVDDAADPARRVDQQPRADLHAAHPRALPRPDRPGQLHRLTTPEALPGPG